MSTRKSIYDLKLHERCRVGSGEGAKRVPGGWIYETFDADQVGNNTIARVFVPYSEEFKPSPMRRDDGFNHPAA